jgi:cell division protein FtsI/penicillin-binding protein 2
MSWKAYQRNLPRRNRARRGKNKKSWGKRLCLCIGVGVASYVWMNAAPLMAPSPAPAPKSAQTHFDVPVEALDLGVEEVKQLVDDHDIQISLTLDQDLQKFIEGKLAKYDVDWAGVAVVQPHDGKVLALASHSAKNPDSHNLSLQSTFPAASIFKMVTAAAAIEQIDAKPTTQFQYAGNMKRIQQRYLSQRYSGTRMTLSEAFAKSANGIFGKIGSMHLPEESLLDYASRFGFNQAIPLETEVGTSHVFTEHLNPANKMDRAKLAAGFGKVTLSPLHGALIAASAVNDGLMMKPYLVDHVRDETQLVYASSPRVWKQPYGPEGAEAMRSMMRHTVQSGTARKSFRRRAASLQNIEIGGKTGSLYGKMPKGRNEWFVSYAKDPVYNENLAVGVVIVNEKYWKIKPAQLTQWIYQYYYQRQHQNKRVAQHSESKHGA